MTSLPTFGCRSGDSEPKLPPTPEPLRIWAPHELLGDSSVVPSLNSTAKSPRAKAEGDAEDTPVELLHLHEHPHISLEWKRYIERVWTPWAEKHKKWKQFHDTYSTLFSIHQELAKAGEELELVVGVGLPRLAYSRLAW